MSTYYRTSATTEQTRRCWHGWLRWRVACPEQLAWVAFQVLAFYKSWEIFPVSKNKMVAFQELKCSCNGCNQCFIFQYRKKLWPDDQTRTFIVSHHRSLFSRQSHCAYIEEGQEKLGCVQLFMSPVIHERLIWNSERSALLITRWLWCVILCWASWDLT